ncbi:uncharacterized protein ALTATR162_LOCUS5161 [Alternaria atra]|uniref:Uncharacterized protein n=1 Tax=Alternaria atra TaxID=119953 RepID=A0A8J2N607_9PLEO|nr:uncharacterized protein ALTATR162_LOCUS5161 [Alternaria atra]CAG5158601.1 unnamed protein product [Alternaria atra]
MQDIIMLDTATPEDDELLSFTTQDDLAQAASTLWSKDECLFIHLQAELALAVASLPVAAALPADDATYYLNFCQFFEDKEKSFPKAASKRTTSITAKGQDEYLLKRNELVLPVLWKTQVLMIAALRAGGFKLVKRWKVAPKVFDEYRKIREMVEYDKKVQDPRDFPEMWRFLDRVVREKFPDSCASETKSGSADGSGIASEVATDGIASESLVRDDASGADAHTANGAAPASNDPLVVGTTRPTTETIVELTQVPDLDIASSQVRKRDRTNHAVGGLEKRLGPVDFAKETGSIQCTAFVSSSGNQCERRARREVLEEERSTWTCHLHSKTVETTGQDKKKRKKVIPSQEDKSKSKASEKHTSQAAKLIEEGEDDDDDDGGPPRKHIKSASKLKPPKARSATRAGNDPWDYEERAIIVRVWNKWIWQHGLAYWEKNFTGILCEACNQVNEHRSQYPNTYGGREPRKVDAVRSQVTKKPVVIHWRAKAKSLMSRIKDDEEIEETELKPAKDLFKVADIEPGKKEQ